MFAFAAPAFAGGVSVFDDGTSKLKMEAELYLNTYYQKAETITPGANSNTKTYGLGVDRVYFTAKYMFNNDWSMRITTDMGHEAGLGKKQNIYLKYAYLQGKLAGDAAVLRLGQSHTPWIDYEEHLWGHRYVSKVLIDQYSMENSSDLGVGLKGKLANGLIGYFVTETNGTGYGNGARSGGLDFDARIGIYPIDGLTLDAQFRDGYRGTKVSGTAPVSGVKSTLWQLMATYGAGHDWRVGVNYVNNRDKARSAGVATSSHGGYTSSGFTTALVNDEVKSTGIALWARAKMPGSSNFGAFGRFESMTNKGISGGLSSTNEKVKRYLVGVEYTAIKGVDFSLVMDQSKLTNRGGVAGNDRKDTRIGIYSKVDL